MTQSLSKTKSDAVFNLVLDILQCPKKAPYGMILSTRTVKNHQVIH